MQCSKVLMFSTVCCLTDGAVSSLIAHVLIINNNKLVGLLSWVATCMVNYILSLATINRHTLHAIKLAALE